MDRFATTGEHLEAELRRLDLLIHREILRLRAVYALSLDEFRGLYISNEQVDRLIRHQSVTETASPSVETLNRQASELRGWIDSRLDSASPWAQLVADFDLDSVDADILLAALAPEMNVKYETLYAYLNNDVTRKWLTVDLAVRLAAPGRRLAQDSPLISAGLLQPFQSSPERSTWMSSGLNIAPAVVSHLLGGPELDPVLAESCSLQKDLPAWKQVPVSSSLRAQLQRAGELLKEDPHPWLVFVGRRGAGKRSAAGAICASLKLPLLTVDLTAASCTHIGPALVLQTRLSRCGLYLLNGETLFDAEGRPLLESRAWLRMLGAVRQPVFLGLPPGCDWRELLQDRPALSFDFTGLDYGNRVRVWKSSLKEQGCSLPEADLVSLANRFILSPGQVEQTVALACSRQAVLGKAGEPLGHETLLEAAREASGQSLGRLAVKLQTGQVWQDLVLPVATLRQAREVASAIRNYRLVYEQWGFAQRNPRGRGLKVLFSGASGTGKTMTAGVIAGELGLDLYKIDLSGVVSKYIGETEKNLERIFRAAENSNAILFFDEADALFGKRSEVKDAHDRYANIEVAYLLQKIEDFEGVVILASNLSQNIDEAFARRMHYVLEFPLPDESHREVLWRGMFPSQAPLGADVDFPFLARQFPLSGGDIRNVSLDSAFMASQDGKVIRMQHLVRAMARQMLKQGRLPAPADFKQYYAQIAQD